MVILKGDILAVYHKKEVTEYMNEVILNPLVSVCIQTYNHVNYMYCMLYCLRYRVMMSCQHQVLMFHSVYFQPFKEIQDSKMIRML